MKYINIFGEIDEVLTNRVLEQIYEIENEIFDIEVNNSKLVDENDMLETEPLMVNINTNGGNISGAFAIYDALKSLNCDVITRVNGYCMSAGIILLLAGDKKLSGKNSLFMIHNLIYSYYDSLPNQERMLSYSKKIQKKVDDIITSNSNINKEYLQENREVDTYLFSEDAKKLGLIDEIIN